MLRLSQQHLEKLHADEKKLKRRARRKERKQQRKSKKRKKAASGSESGNELSSSSDDDDDTDTKLKKVWYKHVTLLYSCDILNFLSYCLFMCLFTFN